MVAQTTDVVSPVGVSVAHTLAPCQPAPRKPRTIRPALPMWEPLVLPAADGEAGAYDVVSETQPGVTYRVGPDRAYPGRPGVLACECRSWINDREDLSPDDLRRNCKHTLAVAAYLRERQLPVSLAVEPVAEVVDPVLLAAATSGTDSSAGQPAPCAWKDVDGRCHSAANGTFGQGVYCLPHAWDAYGLGLLDWANARPSTAVSNRTPALDLPAPSPDARLCPGCGQPAADGGYTHCTVNRATRRSYCGARAGDLLEAFGG